MVYCDEFVFRYNRRRDLALAFRTLLGYGATREPTTYATIRGAGDMPKIIYTPSRKERGRSKGDRGRGAATAGAIAPSDDAGEIVLDVH